MPASINRANTSLLAMAAQRTPDAARGIVT
jgi:hypothetical protein